MNLAREILKLAKKKQKEKTKNRRAIRKAKKARKVRKSLSGDIARTNESVTGYNSGELYEQETTIQPVKEDKKVSAIQPVKEEKKMPKVFRKVSTSGEKEKQVTEKPMAVIPPQVIKTPDPPAPEVIELEDNQSQAIEDTEDVPQILEEIRGIQQEVRGLQQYIIGVTEEEFHPRYSPIEPSYSPNTPEYSPSNSPTYPPPETTVPDTGSEAIPIQVEEFFT